MSQISQVAKKKLGRFQTFKICFSDRVQIKKISEYQDIPNPPKIKIQFKKTIKWKSIKEEWLASRPVTYTISIGPLFEFRVTVLGINKNIRALPTKTQRETQKETIKQVRFGLSLSSFTGIRATNVPSNSFGISPEPLQEGQGTWKIKKNF